MYLNLADILLLTSILQSLALAAFLLIPANIRLTSNRLLLATVLAFAAGLTEVFLYSTGLAQRFLNLAYLGTLIGLLQAGLLYLYAKSLMFQEFKLHRRHLVHSLLFWVVGAIFVVEYYLQPDELKRQILLERDHPGVLTSPLMAAAIHLVFLGYLVATIRAIRTFGMGVREIFSNIDNKQLNWLRALLLGYAVVWSVSLVYCLSAHVWKSDASVQWVSAAGGMTGFLFINYLLIHALRQPIVFSGLSAEESRLLASRAEVTAEPPADSDLLARLERHMQQAKPYLDANLTVNQLARQLSVPARELSRTINQGRDQNFFEFISAYRIAEAKSRLLADTNQTILQVMYDSGFNSKSVFNTAFKRTTGMTPSAYRARPPRATDEVSDLSKPS